MDFIRNILTFFFISLTLLTHAQNCDKALWVKSFGGNSQYQSVADGDRYNDGTFAICASYGDASLAMGTTVFPDSGYYHYLLARFDSSGAILSGKLAAWYTNSSDICVIKKIHVGSDNSVFITGYWKGSTVMIGDNLLPSATRNRTFVSRFDSSLQHIWTRVSDWMSADCQANDVTSDASGNVYVVGTFEDNAFKIGDFAVENYGGWNMWDNDAFLMKLNSQGQTLFLKAMGTPQDDAAMNVLTDNSGDIIVFGHTNQSTSVFKFDEFTGIPGSTTGNAMFYAKYSSIDGHCIWGRMAGSNFSSSTLYAYDACPAGNNKFLLTGQIAGMLNLEPHSYYSADGNGFVAMFDGEGENLWLKTIGGQNSSEIANRISYYNGKIAVSGSLYSNQPYAGDYPLFSTLSGGSYRAFNVVFDTLGHTIWGRVNKLVNTSSDNYYNGCVLFDNSGNQLLWGNFKGQQTWYPETLTNSLSNAKIFCVRFSPFMQTAPFNVSAGADKQTSCGTSIQLNGSTTPTSGVTFGWFPDLGFSSNGSKTPYVNPGMPQMYVFYGFYQGCMQTDTVEVSYSNHDIIVSLPQSVQFCGGDSIQINTICNQPTATFIWAPAAFINTSTAQNPYLKPPYTTEYIVTATYNGCSAIDTVSVFARGKPYIYLPKQDLYYSYWRTHLCDGDTMPVVFGSPLNSYTTTSPTQLYNFYNNEASILPVQGLLKIQAVSPYGCLAADCVNVVVHNNLSAPLIMGITENKHKCPGDSANLNIWFTNSVNYNFQYSWYGGWQIDSLDGSGWHDISIWDKNYEISNYSTGYSTSSYFSTLRIKTVTQAMNGYRFRSYINDYCSPRGYGNTAILYAGPVITTQPVNKTICQGATDSLQVNSTDTGATYSWEIRGVNGFEPLVVQAGLLETNGRFLKIIDAMSSLDSIWVRCRVTGCTPLSDALTDSALVRVVPEAQVLAQDFGGTFCENDSASIAVDVLNPSLYTYLWYQDGDPLTSNTLSLWGYNSPQLHFTPLNTSLNGKTYTCEITNLQCSLGIFSDSAGFNINPLPSVLWSQNDLILCVGSGVSQLSEAQPTGGVYSGTGIINNTPAFSTDSLSPGVYNIFYTYTDVATQCSSVVQENITVAALPIVNWQPTQQSFCIYDAAVALLGGSPAGGTYSGDGVTNGMFSPVDAGIGEHALMYAFSDTNNCVSIDSSHFTVDLCTGLNFQSTNEFWAYVEDAHVFFSCFNNAEPYTVSLYAADGQWLGSEDYSRNCSTCRFNMKLKSQGLYALVMKSNKFCTVLKLLIVK